MAYFTYITKTLFEITLCVVTIYCDSLFQDLAVTVHTFVVQTWAVQSMSATQKNSLTAGKHELYYCTGKLFHLIIVWIFSKYIFPDI